MNEGEGTPMSWRICLRAIPETVLKLIFPLERQGNGSGRPNAANLPALPLPDFVEVTDTAESVIGATQ